ncbi:hypothetical protein HYV49_03480 [Candidatus Pacearchaeota archaeon]|nr:hypothetical protein [Candidatus Pacearchaeota archaeon]
MGISVPIPSNRPRHGYITRDLNQNNGFFTEQKAYYVTSGSLNSVVGGTTGSVSLHFDAYGLRLTRFEVFHSGSAPIFDISLENSTPNTGSFYDARNIIVDYLGVNGSTDFVNGIDQVEDLLTTTDMSGNIYLKFKPYGSGNNWFNYLMFLEAIFIYT